MMPIDFACVCGKSYRAKDKLAGQFFRCRNCGHEAIVPESEPEPGPGNVSTFTPSAAKLDLASMPATTPSLKPALTPMNSVGLFSLLSYSLIGFVAFSVLAMIAWLGVPPGAVFRVLGNWVLAGYLIGSAALAGLGLLVCRLGDQQIVRAFPLWGLRLALLGLAGVTLSYASNQLEATFSPKPKPVAIRLAAPAFPAPVAPRVMVADPAIEAERVRLEAAEAERIARIQAEQKLGAEVAFRARQEAKREAARLAEEQAEAERKRFEELVARVYPAAQKALIDAKNRGSTAPVAIRKASIAREIDKAGDKLCRKFQISLGELDLIVNAGEAADGTAAKRAEAAGKANAKVRVNAQNQQMLGAISNELDRAASTLRGPGSAPVLPPVNNVPIRWALLHKGLWRADGLQ